MNTKILFIVLSLLSIAPTIAMGSTVTQIEIDNIFTKKIIKHYATCVSYFSTLSKIGKMNKYYARNRAEIKLARRKSLHLSLIASKYLANVKNKDELLQSGIEAALIHMRRQLGPNFKNVQKLIETHETSCQKAIEDPSHFVRQQQQDMMQQYLEL